MDSTEKTSLVDCHFFSLEQTNGPSGVCTLPLIHTRTYTWFLFLKKDISLFRSFISDCQSVPLKESLSFSRFLEHKNEKTLESSSLEEASRHSFYFLPLSSLFYSRLHAVGIPFFFLFTSHFLDNQNRSFPSSLHSIGLSTAQLAQPLRFLLRPFLPL